MPIDPGAGSRRRSPPVTPRRLPARERRPAVAPRPGAGLPRAGRRGTARLQRRDLLRPRRVHRGDRDALYARHRRRRPHPADDGAAPAWSSCTTPTSCSRRSAPRTRTAPRPRPKRRARDLRPRPRSSRPISQRPEPTTTLVLETAGARPRPARGQAAAGHAAVVNCGELRTADDLAGWLASASIATRCAIEPAALGAARAGSMARRASIWRGSAARSTSWCSTRRASRRSPRPMSATW